MAQIRKTGEGLKIGKSTDKIGFYGATPVVKPTVDTSGDAAADIAAIVAALVALGLVTESA